MKVQEIHRQRLIDHLQVVVKWTLALIAIET
jgi:hypothetical protein